MEKGIFRYQEWQELFLVEKPFQILINLPADPLDQRRTNLSFSDHEEEIIENVRHHVHDFPIDTHGFVYTTHESALSGPDFNSREIIESV